MKRLFPLFLFLMVQVSAQIPETGKFFGAGINLGMIGFSPSPMEQLEGSSRFFRTTVKGIGRLTDVNGDRQITVLGNTSAGVHAGFSYRISYSFLYLGGGFQANKAIYGYSPPFLITHEGDSMTTWVESNRYLHYFGSLSFGYKISDGSFLGGARFVYLSGTFGKLFRHRNFTQKIEVGQEEDWVENNTGFRLKTVLFNPESQMISGELGLRFFGLENRGVFDIGLVYRHPMLLTYSREYEFFQDGLSTGKTRINFNGNTISFNARYTYQIRFNDREPREKLPKEKWIAENPELNGREIDVQSEITVKQERLVVEIYDKGLIDGDSVSLFLNGELILAEYGLLKSKLEVELKLKPGYNFIVMEALNVGTQPPNSAVMEIVDGRKRKSVKISSTLQKSGAIEIYYKPKKK